MVTPDLLIEQEAAQYLRRASGTLRQWRYKGEGPPYVRVGGGRIAYRRADLDAWLTEHTVRPEAVSS